MQANMSGIKNEYKHDSECTKKRICADVIASAFKMFDMTGLVLDQ